MYIYLRFVDISLSTALPVQTIERTNQEISQVKAGERGSLYVRGAERPHLVRVDPDRVILRDRLSLAAPLTV